MTTTPEPHRLERPETEWQRVSPKYITVDMISTLIFGAIVTAAGFLPFWLGWQEGWFIGAALGAIFLLTLALTPRRVRAIGYLLRDDDLLFRRGIMFQRFVSVPYGRMQLVDINRGPLVRAFGLAELKFVTAAASSGVTIPGLPFETAEQLRDHLVAVAETRRAGL
ncbi:PH domain-containing protein [Microcella sp.]|uniref:PH domain-containing protein n=1 Tax=Microcella sp. TaxID=1913979 RepID=UPI00256CB250|nr:PH domain-containing protein [Microcella sp.]MBX9472310.1 PH domain-containing protein [Microcella sp.]